MNYKLIGDNDYIFDPQGTILRNRGIEDIDTFLNLTEDVTYNYKLLKNIDRAIECVASHIENKNNILIVADPDVDGYTSSAIIYQYLKMIDEDLNIEYALHNDKTHGLKNIEVKEHIHLVIVPDAGSNDFEYHEQLFRRGIDVIVLDHHEIDKESEFAIVVNTLLGYPNQNLSGAGVAYKFCKGLDDYYWSDYADQFLDLVALGNIADSMSMKELETRYYVQQGLGKIKNEFFRQLIIKQEYSMKGKVNITTINFYISPLINAVVRIGEMQDKIDMFKSFIGQNEMVKYKPRGKDETFVPLIEDMARRCTNIKAKQGRIADKIILEIDNVIEEEQLNNNKVLFIHNVDIDKGLTGYLANRVAGKYKKPVILLSECDENGIYKGSARGYDKSDLKDFRTVTLNTNLFNFAKGHLNAYGLEISKENINKVNDKLNQELSAYNFEDLYIVDFEIESNSLTDELVFEICKLEDVWGKDVDEPYIVIKNIKVSESEIDLIGTNENTISIYNNDLKYIMFKTDREFYNKVMKKKTIDIIGKFSINEYRGEQYPQIVIESIIL